MTFKRYEFGHGDKAVILFHGWKSSYLSFTPLFPALKSKYHVIAYDYSKDVLSADTNKTVNEFKAIVSDAISAVKGCSEVHIIGLSLGSYLSLFTASKIKLVKKIVLLVAGNSIAYDVWHGQSLIKIKEELVLQGKTFDDLKKEWSKISPIKLKNKSISIVAGTKDKILLAENTVCLVKQLKKDNFVKEKYYPQGHVQTIILGLYNFKEIITFLES